MKVKFGTGRRCINPEFPISLAGYFNRRVWDKILDDIEVRAVVFKDNGKLHAIIQFDLLCVNINLSYCVFEALKAAGLKEFSSKNLLICTTHSHTCPDINNEPNSLDYCRFIAGKAAYRFKNAEIGVMTEKINNWLAAKKKENGK